MVMIDKIIAEGKMGEYLDRAELVNKERVHLIGLVSDAGIYSHIDHLKSLVRNFKGRCKELYIHCIADGVDVEPRSFQVYLASLRECINEVGFGEIASLSGRKYSMSRGGELEKIKEYYNTIKCRGRFARSMSPEDYIKAQYEKGISDEFFRPRLFLEKGKIGVRDTVVFFNVRSYDIHEIVYSFIRDEHEVFITVRVFESCEVGAIFSMARVENGLDEVLSKKDLPQAQITDSKNSNLFYFFTGRLKDFSRGKMNFFGDERVYVYDPKLKMNTLKAVQTCMRVMKNNVQFIVCNFPPLDQIGYVRTCKEEPYRIVEEVDKAVGVLYEICRDNDYTLVITADHVNSGYMRDINGNLVEKRTIGKVPLIICSNEVKSKGCEERSVGTDYSLRDVAPTILHIMGIEIPPEMTGSSLVYK
ncbi:2,3-bisphosphoglycerate-independent phosphoglycerate mutase-like [Nylanderia fulva]|nr:2,3-bisphosphoglycerate-independent phosphoglycerate mutase-like [Nylanderia fulva]